MRIAISAAAAGLLRALATRGRVPRDRILLTEACSIDWRSLTFTGERHHIQLRILGPDATRASETMCAGLEDAEFSIPGQIVADIALVGEPKTAADGSVSLAIEALTVSAD